MNSLNKVTINKTASELHSTQTADYDMMITPQTSMPGQFNNLPPSTPSTSVPLLWQMFVHCPPMSSPNHIRWPTNLMIFSTLLQHISPPNLCTHAQRALNILLLQQPFHPSPSPNLQSSTWWPLTNLTISLPILLQEIFCSSLSYPNCCTWDLKSLPQPHSLMELILSPQILIHTWMLLLVSHCVYPPLLKASSSTLSCTSSHWIPFRWLSLSPQGGWCLHSSLGGINWCQNCFTQFKANIQRFIPLFVHSPGLWWWWLGRWCRIRWGWTTSLISKRQEKSKAHGHMNHLHI